jgi:hypothetical protein
MEKRRPKGMTMGLARTAYARAPALRCAAVSRQIGMGKTKCGARTSAEVAILVSERGTTRWPAT